MGNIKIAFLGVPDFGTYILEGLIKNGYEPIVLDSHEKIKEIKPDLTIVASYGKIIPKDILEIPQYGTLNIHPSLLPKYRGASPIQTAILNDDKVTGISIMLMDEKMDHGGIISSVEYQVLGKPTYKELEKELAKIAIEELVKVLPRWIKGEIKPKEQDHSQAIFTKIFKKEDGKIDCSQSIEEIERQIRALNPWPGSFVIWKGKIIKILEAQIEDNKLIINKIQPEGKKPMAMDDFLRGHQDFKLC